MTGRQADGNTTTPGHDAWWSTMLLAIRVISYNDFFTKGLQSKKNELDTLTEVQTSAMLQWNWHSVVTVSIRCLHVSKVGHNPNLSLPKFYQLFPGHTVPNTQISRKSIHRFSSYSANEQKKPHGKHYALHHVEEITNNCFPWSSG